MIRLPPEDIDYILDYLHDDFKTLGACALAGRIMLPSARFHRFRDVKLPPWGNRSLAPLLNSADLARVITSVTTIYMGLRDPCDDFKFLLQLPCLCKLTLVTPPPQQFPTKTLSVIASYAPALTSFTLIGPGGTTPSHLVSAISEFGTLEELGLQHITIDDEDDVSYAPHPPRLRRLVFHDCSNPSIIVSWLQVHSAEPPLQSLRYFLRGQKDVAQLNTVAAWCASSLKSLEVIFAPHGSMAAAFRDVVLPLSSFSVLESCTLRFVLHEMCVAQNESLKWIPLVLAQLSSPCIRKVTISLVVDNVEDLRSLNSECAVRDLTCAYLDDMFVLDWDSMERSLASDHFASLRILVIEGQGSGNVLKAHVQKNIPTLHSRDVISLATVAKRAPWIVE
ncbi:hypothetical protein C8Q79DRAFT_1010453 [Trametes meyenii]|nr:hypothetical protein C8Q79DRAFT_1010453 [Trametes meyenii]